MLKLKKGMKVYNTYLGHGEVIRTDESEWIQDMYGKWVAKNCNQYTNHIVKFKDHEGEYVYDNYGRFFFAVNGEDKYFTNPEELRVTCEVFIKETESSEWENWVDYSDNNIYSGTVKTTEPIKDVVEDNINHPKHYTSHPSGVECIDITKHMDFLLGNAFKYIWRYDLKEDKIEDLEKAIFYIKTKIEMIKNAEK
jgi:hypothetical protein